MGLTTYNTLQILDTTPIGDAGQALNTNFTLLGNHIVDTTGNPHSVTASQIGSYTIPQVDLALSGKAKAVQYYITDWGASPTATDAINRAAFQNAISGIDAIGGGTLIIPPGRYRISDNPSYATAAINSVNLVNDINIIFEPNAIIDATGCSSDIIWYIGGTNPRTYSSQDWTITSSNFSDNLSLGTTSGTLVTDLALSSGDTVFMSTQYYRNTLDSNNGSTVFDAGNGDELWIPDSRYYYYKGEFSIVDSYNPTTNLLKFRRTLNDNYTGANTYIAKLTAPRINLYNVTIEGNATNVGLQVCFVRGGEIKGGKITGCRYTGLFLEYIYQYIIDGIQVEDMYVPAGGAQYGILAAGQESVIQNCRLFGGRHAISFGYYEPNRDWTIANCVVDNDLDTTQVSLDFHENAERITLLNNTIGNGLRICARNINSFNNQVSVRNAAYGISFYPCKSDYGFSSNNDTITSINTISKPAYGIYFTVDNVNVPIVNINNAHIHNCNALVYTRKTDVNITGCVLQKLSFNNTYAYLNYYTTEHIPALWSGTTASNKSPSIDKIQLNNVYCSTDGVIESIYNYNGRTKLEIHNSHFKFRASGAVPMTTTSQGIGDIVFTNTTFEGTEPTTGYPSRFYLSLTGYNITLHNVTFKNFDTTGGLYTDCNELDMLSCKHINCVDQPSLTAVTRPNRYLKDINFIFPGIAITGLNQTNPVLVNYSGQVLYAKVIANTAPSGGDINFGINKNGSRIQTTATRLTLPNLTTIGSSTTFADNNYKSGDYYTMDIDHVGSGYGGSNIAVSLITQQYII